VSSAYGFSDARLSSLAHDLSGTSQDQSYAYTRNALGDIIARDGSNDSYDFVPLAAGTTSYADNGLNQYTSVGGVAQSYDSRANLTTGGFGYDAQNRLTSAGGATFAFDPEGRLYQTSASGTTTRFLYAGLQIIGEYNGSGCCSGASCRVSASMSRWSGTKAPARATAVGCCRMSAARSSRSPMPRAPRRRSTPTTNTASSAPQTRAASNMPAIPGSRKPSSITCARACTPPRSAASCSPIPSSPPGA
jgi:hypothetical protein